MTPRLSLAALALVLAQPAGADVVKRLPTDDKVVALTFDACEAGEVAHLDHGIADYLVANHIPFTVFMGGKFARDNPDDARWLASQPTVEIENHSWSHNNHMPRLSDERVQAEVTRAADEIFAVTGRQTHLFRFPAGNSDPRTEALVSALGHEIVGWRWAVGDPVKGESAKDIVAMTLKMTRPGDILIYHINGRGWHTAEALPRVIEGLKAQGYRFVLMRDYLPQPATETAANNLHEPPF